MDTFDTSFLFTKSHITHSLANIQELFAQIGSTPELLKDNSSTLFQTYFQHGIWDKVRK